MADCDQDGKAGDSCTVCETPPKCFHQYTIIDSNGKTIVNVPETHQGKASITRILQSKKNATYSFKLKGKCRRGNDECPMTSLPNAEYLYGTNTKEDILSYSDSYNWSNMSLLRWLKEYFVFDVTKLSTRFHPLPIIECNNLVHLATLVIYPTYKLSIKFTYGKEISAAKAEDRRPRYTYTTDEAEEITSQTGKQWSEVNKQLVKADSSNGLSGVAEIGEFKEDLGLIFNEKERYSDDNPIFKIKSLINKVNNSLLSNNGNIGPVRDITLVGPNIEITGTKELKQNGTDLYFEYSAALEFAPLIGVRATIDLIDIALQCINAALPSVGYVAAKSWRELRTTMIKAKKNFEENHGNGGYVKAGIDLILAGEFGNCSVSVYKDANYNTAGRGKGGAELSAEVKGYFEGELKIWAIEGSLNASVSAKTGIGASIIVEKEGVGVCWKHDGVKIVFECELKAGIRDKYPNVSFNMEAIILTLSESYESEPYYICEFS